MSELEAWSSLILDTVHKLSIYVVHDIVVLLEYGNLLLQIGHFYSSVSYRLLRIGFETSMCKFNKFNKFNFDITKTTSQCLMSIVALLLPRVHVKIIFACSITAKSKIAIKNFLTRARQKTIIDMIDSVYYHKIYCIFNAEYFSNF